MEQKQSSRKLTSLGLLAVLLMGLAMLLAACGETATPAATVNAVTTSAAASSAAATSAAAPPQAATTAATTSAAPPQAATTVATTLAATGKKGGTVKIAVAQEPDTLNPFFASQDISSIIAGTILEGLVDVNPDGKYVPILATEVPTLDNGGISKDGLTVTYKLRKDVKWSDGQAFTAKDVIFTYKVVLDPANGIPTSGYADLDSLTNPDDYTIIAKFKNLHAPFLSDMFGTILPEHSFNGATNISKSDYNRKPIGTGPFMVKSFTPENVTEERNPNYRESGKPYLDGVIWVITPSSETAIQGFKTGEFDAIWDLNELKSPILTK